MGTINIYLADRQILFREGMHFILSSQENLEVIGETDSNEEAIDFIESNPPNIAILNINDTEPSGIEIARRIKKNVPSVSVILIIDDEDDQHVFSAMKSGASAYVTRYSALGEFIKTVIDVAQGGRPISKALLKPSVARLVLAEFESLSLFGKKMKDTLAQLVPSEIETLRIIAEGTPGGQLPIALNIGEEALTLHLNLILSKLVTNDQLRELIDAARHRL